MLLSTKGRYGLRMMFELALHYSDGMLSLKDIANNLQLSDTYLEQLMALLKKAELVKSTRGAQGGYLLSKPPMEITVGEIIRTLEGPIAVSDCVSGEDTECSKKDYCVTRLIWERITESINGVVDTTTLGDMIKDYCDLNYKNSDK